MRTPNPRGFPVSSTLTACEHAALNFARPSKEVEMPVYDFSLMRKTQKRAPVSTRRAPSAWWTDRHTLETDYEVKFAPTGKKEKNKKGELKEVLMPLKIGRIYLLNELSEGFFGPPACVFSASIVRKTSCEKLRPMRAKIARTCGESAAEKFDSLVKKVQGA
jgi:hypothetical protein